MRGPRPRASWAMSSWCCRTTGSSTGAVTDGLTARSGYACHRTCLSNFIRRHGKPIHRAELLHDTPFRIGAQYQQEYRGVVEYYRLAYNLHAFNRVKWVMERSLVQTLAYKLGISVR